MAPDARMNFFSPELRTASIVPRWSVVWTLTRDTVSNHSFFVEMYADEIADVINWKQGLDKQIFEARYHLCRYARFHDLDETVTGDIVSPVKAEIIDDMRANTYILGQMQERMPRVVAAIEEMQALPYWQDIRAIVKAADRLDALLFLVGERRMGNGVVVDRIPSAWKNLKQAWFNLPCRPGDTNKMATTWRNVIEPAVLAHTNSGGHGV